MLSYTPPRIVVRDVGEQPTRIIAPVGEHDLATVRQFRAALECAIEGGCLLIVDMRRTTFADSSFLGSIVMAANQAGRQRLAVVLPTKGEVARLFELVDVGAFAATFHSLRLAVEWTAANWWHDGLLAELRSEPAHTGR